MLRLMMCRPTSLSCGASRALLVVRPAAALTRPAAALTRPVASLARALLPRADLCPPISTRTFASTPARHPDLEQLEDEFAEARELLSDAEEAMGTTYFNDDLKDAREATEKVLERYESMKASLPKGSNELIELQRSLGLKIEELRGRLGLLIQTLIEDD